MVLYFFCPLISQTTCLTDLAHCPKAVAGFHRAVPSTALDKDMYSLTPYILYKNSGFVKGNFRQPSGKAPH